MFSTALTIFELACMHTPLMLGAYLTMYVMKLPDLGLETAFGIGALASTVALLHTNCSTWGLAGTLLCCCAAASAAAFTGLFIAYLTQKERFSHLLATILVQSIAYAVYLATIGAHASLHTTMTSYSMHLVKLTLCAAGTIAFVHYFLRKQIGTAVAIYGWNRKFFQHYLISESFVYSVGVVTAYTLAGISGYLCAESNGFITAHAGSGKVVLCIVTLVIGNALTRSTQKMTLMVPLVGCIAYFTLQFILLKIGIMSSYFGALQAIITIGLLKLLQTRGFLQESHL